MNNEMILRMRDVAICLNYTQNNLFFLSKIQLQKLIYLLDSVSSYMYILSVKRGHKTYYHGPYDKNIQNAADALVLYGYADMRNIKFLDNGNSTCEYYLTDEGRKWIKYLIDENLNTQLRWDIVSNLFESIIKRGLFKDIVSLVYAEPLYTKNQGNGYGILLDFENLEENDIYNFLLIVLDAFDVEKDNKLIGYICDLLVTYLNRRRIALAVHQED